MSPVPWSVLFAADAVEDLALIEAHLIRAYRAFGEQPIEAVQHAQARVEAIIAAAERLAMAPLRGEAHDELLPGLRHLALDGAVYWFRPLPPMRDVQVLAVFFGGQDHQRHMLVRLLQKP
jgi:plasmid stabilization system protein ParE